MVWLTRSDHEKIVLNCDLIEYIESTPDTVITMTTGQKLRVYESPEEVVRRVIAFRRSIADISIGTSGAPQG
jgi:flagellar protein FlbD